MRDMHEIVDWQKHKCKYTNTNMDLNRNNVLGKCFDAYKEHKLTEMLHVFSFLNGMFAE